MNRLPLPRVRIVISESYQPNLASRALIWILSVSFSAGLTVGPTHSSLLQAYQIGKTVIPATQGVSNARWLELGKPIEREMVGGQSHSYQVAVTAGQHAKVVVEQKGMDVVVKLFAPDGKVITAIDNPNGSQGPEPVHITAEATGIYQLEVTSFRENAPAGRYEAELVELRAATQQDRDRLAARRAFDEGERLRNQDSRESLDAAIKKGEEALSLYQAIGDRSEQYIVLLGMSSTHRMRREPQKAIERLNQALQIAKALGDSYRQARSLQNTAEVYANLSDWGKELPVAVEALQLYQTAGDKILEAEMLNVIGTVYSFLGEVEKAREYFERLIPLYQTLGDKNGEARTLRRIGYAYHLERNSQKTLEYSIKALAIWQALENKTEEAGEQASVSSDYARAGDRPKAVYHAQRALLLAQAPGIAPSKKALIQVNAGSAFYKLAAFEKALALYNEALPIWQTAGSKRNEAVTLWHIAQAQQHLNRLPEAQLNIEKAIGMVEDLRDHVGTPELKASFVATLFDFYETYGDLIMQLHAVNPKAGHDLTALSFSEKVKGRSLIELLRKARVDLQPGAESQRLAKLTEPEPLIVKDIQQQLDGDTILLEYQLGNERSYLWEVTIDSVLSYQLPTREEIEGQARRVYQLLIARQPAQGLTDAQQRAREVAADAQYQTQATILSNMVLGPVAARLGTKRLLIVADGALQYLPFAALPVPAMQGTKMKTEPRALILDHEIVSLPSASVLAMLRRELANRQPATKMVAVFADPVFSADDARVKQSVASKHGPNARTEQAAFKPSSDSVSNLSRAVRSVRGEDERAGLRRLLFSRDEAATILSVVKPRQSGLEALDFRASRKMAMSDELSQYRIIHFSTHGLLDSRHPELSGLVLSLVDEAGQPQEGLLRLHDIYGLRLNADLVVLSACQTGLGKDIRGEGLIGLTRGFMYAGTPRVVASLWQVDDAATAELMKRFYRGVLQGNLAPAAALRVAQIEMLKKKQWQSPYYWGAFVLQGEWR